MMDFTMLLRNKIYGLTLKEPDGLYYRFAKYGPPRLCTKALPSRTESGLSHIYEANQLKYVCRQLYHETNGFGMKFNNLTSTRIDLDHPIPRCFQPTLRFVRLFLRR
jgi:hypothetical protein